MRPEGARTKPCKRGSIVGEPILSEAMRSGGREVRATTVAIVFLLLCLAVFVGVFAYFIHAGVQQARQDMETRSQAAAQNIATNASWMEQLAHQTLRRVDAALGPSMTGDEPALQPAIEGLPSNVEVYIIDANADTIFATVPNPSNINVADREYFYALRDGARFYTSGLLRSRLTNENIFVFSKRVERNGVFAGAIMVSFDEDVLASFWRSLELDPGSTVSLIRRDGTLMARYPSTDQDVSMADHPLVTEMLPQAEFGTYFSEASPIDNIQRVVSYRAVPGSQIVAVAGIATSATWRGLNSAIISVLVLTAPIVAALIAFGIWIVRLLRRDAARREELEKAQETNVLLFREIHHRVKNNLQSVQSLVRMQEMPRSARVDLQSRLSAMAAMHEHIYRHDKYEDIDAHDLVPVVVNEVVNAYGSDAEINYDIDHIGVDRDHATPLSLLLSELITNALKYAFEDGRQGRIDVTLRRKGDDRCVLVVEDNGVGIGELPATPTSMGLRLIRGVVSQMGGTYQFTSENGTRFEASLALQSAGHHAPARPAISA